jgi:hypothetical protein
VFRAVVVWPGVTKPGSRSDVRIQSTDLYPTILRMLNVEQPKDHVIDGVDFAKALRGEMMDRGPMFTHVPGHGAAKETLEGPYKVWVRQLESSGTTQEVQDAFSEQLQLLEKRQADGDSSITDDVINRIKDFIKTGRPMLLGSSARDVSDKELTE